jgi:hypothetical protein
MTVKAPSNIFQRNKIFPTGILSLVMQIDLEISVHNLVLRYRF